MKSKLLLVLASLFLFVYCSKKDIPEPTEKTTDTTVTVPVNDSEQSSETPEADSDESPDTPNTDLEPIPDYINKAETHYMILTKSDNRINWDIYIDAEEEDKKDLWIDLNLDGVKNEGEEVTFGSKQSIDVVSKTIVVYGKVIELDCSYNQLTTLDVTKNPVLKKLDCSYNQLTTLDVTKNLDIKIVKCKSNEITVLDVTKNTSLNVLFCGSNRLTALDVTKNHVLKNLNCGNGILTDLNVTQNSALIKLDCSRNKLTSLNVTNNTSLKVLDCEYNKLSELNISNNKLLNALSIHGNKITDSNNMQTIVNDLPNLKDNGRKGYFFVVESKNSKENKISKNQVVVAKGKGWEVLDSETYDYAGE